MTELEYEFIKKDGEMMSFPEGRYGPPRVGKKFVDLNPPEFQLPAENFKRVYRIPEALMNHSPYSGYYGKFYEYLYKRID